MSNTKLVSNATILIADDNTDNLRLLQEYLEAEDYQLRLATNGDMAIKSALASTPDLILLDIHMPQVDGYEACRQIKSYSQLKNIPVIFLSALSENFNKLKAFELGAVDYIVKPFELQEVRARVQTHLKNSQQMADIERFNKVMMNREVRIIELKKEVNQLLKAAGEKLKYPSVED